MKFAPRLVPTLATILVFGATCRLGFWQIDRYYQSTAIAEHMEAQWANPPLKAIPGVPDPAHHRASVEARLVEAPLALSAGGLIGSVPGYRLVVPARQGDGTTLLIDLGWVPADLDTAGLHALLPSALETFEGLLLPATPPTTPATPEREGRVERWPLDGDRLWGILPRALGPPYGAIAAARGVDHPWVLRVGERHHEERLEPAALPVMGCRSAANLTAGQLALVLLRLRCKWPAWSAL